MDLAMYLEVGMFFLMSTIVIGGALGLIYMQRVAHSMMCLIFCFMGVAGIFILMGAEFLAVIQILVYLCLLYTSPSPRDGLLSRMPSSA